MSSTRDDRNRSSDLRINSSTGALIVQFAQLPLGDDRSGSIANGGAAQVVAAANAARVALDLQNISAGDLWVSENGSPAVIGAAGSYKVPAGGTFSASTSRSISIIGATTAQAWTATER